MERERGREFSTVKHIERMATLIADESCGNGEASDPNCFEMNKQLSNILCGCLRLVA